MIAGGVYVLCAVTSAACAVLLARAYRRQPIGLLFWSFLCFAGLAVNNAMLAIDRLVLPHNNLLVARAAVGFGSVCLLLVGLIWESK